jgi:hypothetical protein
LGQGPSLLLGEPETPERVVQHSKRDLALPHHSEPDALTLEASDLALAVCSDLIVFPLVLCPFNIDYLF